METSTSCRSNDAMDPDSMSADTMGMEPAEAPAPWADEPAGMVYYEKIYDDGHLGAFTNSAETAYQFGWIENRIPESEIQQSDKNGWYYIDDKAPMLTDADKQRQAAAEEIRELKQFLAATDYRAIKYAEGTITAAEYRETKQQRADARERINELEAI